MTATEWFMKAQIEQLEKENKNLKIELWGVQWERDGLKMVVERLHKEIEEQDKEIKNLKDDLLHYIQREEEYRKEIEKLKKELKKYKNDIIYEEWLYD